MEVDHVQVSERVKVPSKNNGAMFMIGNSNFLVAKQHGEVCWTKLANQKERDDIFSKNLSEPLAPGGRLSQSMASVAVDVMFVSFAHSTWIPAPGETRWWWQP